jgi:hypothetical protein
MKDLWTDLRQSTNVHLCSADSIITCENADRLLKWHVDQEEVPSIKKINKKIK